MIAIKNHPRHGLKLDSLLLYLISLSYYQLFQDVFTVIVTMFVVTSSTSSALITQ